MKPPCETIVKKVLPVARALLVTELVGKYKMKQAAVAKKLGITKARVTQYIKKIRGCGDIIKKFKFIVPDVKKLAKKISEKDAKEELALIGLCDLCRKIRKSKEFCRYHRELLKLPKCDACR